MTSQSFAHYSNMRVPRYTSYPTAPHFTPEVGAETYSRWLQAVDPDEPVSLYLHVPYCRQMCWYCGCNMKLAARPEPVTQYTETLRREIGLVAERLPGRTSISHLHWGGGTPTAMTPDDLARCMERVEARFDIASGADLAIECDPRTLEPEMIARIGSLGFTRVSFGVQEFDLRVQTAINRVQPPDMVARAVEGFRGAGVSGINFDLIYGLPHQTVGTLLETIRICLRMRPERIALFGYAHVPWVAKNQRMIASDSLPDAGARMAQSTAASHALTDAGYVAIGLDHFALPDDDLAEALRSGKLRRNFQGYTTDTAQTLLGVGTTSIGKLAAGYIQNIADTRSWARAVNDKTLPVAKGRALSGQDALRGRVIEALMCQGQADLGAFGRSHGFGERWYASAAGALADLTREGLITFEKGRLTLTETGIPLVRVVAATFDEYLKCNQAKHAVAV
ncbi:MAG: oxygen-independent coproporphyrinogen III oxidase [Silicimonas sp.]|nr:oxygen-independent coproporphyrinogen III oxidase [Silicimonas sp.]